MNVRWILGPPQSLLQLGRRVVAAALLVIAATFTSCDSVKFYQKERLADPIMAFGGSPTESHFIAKCTYSREASVGGIGSTAGGGCGCY